MNDITTFFFSRKVSSSSLTLDASASPRNKVATFPFFAKTINLNRPLQLTPEIMIDVLLVEDPSSLKQFTLDEKKIRFETRHFGGISSQDCL